MVPVNKRVGSEPYNWVWNQTWPPWLMVLGKGANLFYSFANESNCGATSRI